MAIQTGRSLINPDKAERGVFVLADDYSAFDSPWHRHARAQFVYASVGVLTARTSRGLWLVTPQRAVWILPNEMHKCSSDKGIRLTTLYAEPRIAPVPDRCCVVAVDPLLTALLIEASTFGPAYPMQGPEQRLVQVILDRLGTLERVQSHLPMPTDSRLLHLTTRLEQAPADTRPLSVLAAGSGMTERTAARLFVKETGLTFGQWRQQLRLLKAMQALSLGDSVSHVAAEVGYQDISAFITVFKRAFGDTPARYFRELGR